MVNTKHTYDLKDIYGGRTYFIKFSKKEEATVVAKTLVGMGYKRMGSWSIENVHKETKKEDISYGIWVYPKVKTFNQKVGNLISLNDKIAVNVFDENYFKRKITYDIFRFVMIEKIFNNKNKTIWEEN